MSFNGFVLIVISITLSAFGQTAFKAGMNRVSFTESANIVSKVGGMLTSPYVLAGLACYAFGTVFWLFALKQMDLSLAYPFIALSIVVVFGIGIVFLGEPIVTTRVVGLVIIIAGLAVMTRA